MTIEEALNGKGHSNKFLEFLFLSEELEYVSLKFLLLFFNVNICYWCGPNEALQPTKYCTEGWSRNTANHQLNWVHETKNPQFSWYIRKRLTLIPYISQEHINRNKNCWFQEDNGTKYRKATNGSLDDRTWIDKICIDVTVF